MSFLTDYQKYYDGFIYENKLDFDDSSWTPEQREQFKIGYRRLEARYAEVATKSSTPDSPAVTRALQRLGVMPGPDDATPEYGDQYIASPWMTVKTVIGSVGPARLETVNLSSLTGTLQNLTRDRISKYITAPALTTDRQYAVVVVKDGVNVIVDGHHRLMAQWLLGKTAAPVWIVEEK